MALLCHFNITKIVTFVVCLYNIINYKKVYPKTTFRGVPPGGFFTDEREFICTHKTIIF